MNFEGCEWGVGVQGKRVGVLMLDGELRTALREHAIRLCQTGYVS